MVRRCVAAGSNNSSQSGFSVFQFPKNSQLRRSWEKQVQRTRDSWKGSTEHNEVCSCHFKEQCFVISLIVTHTLRRTHDFAVTATTPTDIPCTAVDNFRFCTIGLTTTCQAAVHCVRQHWQMRAIHQ